MYIYFNKEGVLTTQINHGEVARQGGTLRLYIAFDKDFDLSNKILDIRFKKPSENYFSNINYFPDSQVPQFKVFEKVKNNEITYDLIEGQTYQVYTWTADSTVGITDEYGNVSIVVRLFEDTDGNNQTIEKILMQGTFQLYVEKTYGNAKPQNTINQTEYNYLVNIVGNVDKRVGNLELHEIKNLSELDNFTTVGIYKIGLSNTIFNLFVSNYIGTEGTFITQVRSNKDGYFSRTFKKSETQKEWVHNQYNVNGIVGWNETAFYSEGAIVFYNGLWACVTQNKGYAPDEDTDGLYWIPIDFANYVNKNNLKTINGESLIGSGDIKIQGSSNSDLENYYTKEEIIEEISNNIAKSKETLLEDVVNFLSNENLYSENINSFASTIANSMSVYSSTYAYPMAGVISSNPYTFSYSIAGVISAYPSIFVDAFNQVISNYSSYFSDAMAAVISCSPSTFGYPMANVISSMPYAFGYPMAAIIGESPYAFVSAFNQVISSYPSSFASSIYSAISSKVDDAIANAGGGSGSKKYMHILKLYSTLKISESGSKFSFIMCVISNSETAYSNLVDYYNEIGDRVCMASGTYYTGLTAANAPIGTIMSAYFSKNTPTISVNYSYLDNSNTSNTHSTSSTGIVWGNAKYFFQVLDVYEI